jgi:hypothetical protein
VTDLEMTRLCAEALCGEALVEHGRVWLVQREESGAWSMESHVYFNPLHDDAQAMALVKRFKLHPVYDAEDQVWHCVTIVHGFYGRASVLNRAIVECVAKMQAGAEKCKPETSPVDSTEEKSVRG